MPSRSRTESRAPLRTLRSRLAGPWPAILLAVICYLPSLGNGLTYDDNSIITANRRIRSLANFRDIWLRDWWYDPAERADLQLEHRDRLYRPLTMYSFALNYAVHSLDPLGYHLVNVLLHAGVCGLVFALARRLTGQAAVASLTALLFAVHPVHAEAVANCVGRAEILAAGFILAGLLLLTRAPAELRPRHAWLAAGLFLLALLSKETSVAYGGCALLLMLWLARGTRPDWPWWAARLAILASPALIYFPLRFFALDQHLLREIPDQLLFNPVIDAAGFERVVAPFTILGFYARLLLLPDKLSCDYGFAVVDPHAGPTLMTLLGVLALGGLTLGLLGWNSPSALRRRCGLYAALFLVSYVLISNSFLLIGVSLAERLMYWPSVAILMLIADCAVGLWLRARQSRPVAGASGNLGGWIAAAFVFVLGLRTASRCPDWADDFALFSADQATYPQDARLNSSLGRLYLFKAANDSNPLEREEHLRRAETLLDRALSIKARFPEALARRAGAYMLRGDNETALRYLQSALLLDPSDRTAQLYIEKLRGQDTQRLADLGKTQDQLAADPNNIELRVELGRTLVSLGRNVEALDAFNAAVQMAPRHIEALRGAADVYALLGRRDEAVAAYERLLAIAPDDWRAHVNISGQFKDTDPSRALAHAQKAWELQPDNTFTRINLAEALGLNGRFAEALLRYEQVLSTLEQNDPFRDTVAERIREMQQRSR